MLFLLCNQLKCLRQQTQQEQPDKPIRIHDTIVMAHGMYITWTRVADKISTQSSHWMLTFTPNDISQRMEVLALKMKGPTPFNWLMSILCTAVRMMWVGPSVTRTLAVQALTCDSCLRTSATLHFSVCMSLAPPKPHLSHRLAVLGNDAIHAHRQTTDSSA